MRWPCLALGLALLSAAAPAFALRVVALSPHLAELVCAAGACEQLVAAVAYSDYPPRVATLPRVGDGFSIRAEAVLAQKPDLVLAWDGGTPPATVDQLRRLGLEVWSLRVERLEQVGGALRALGLRLGTRVVAEDQAQRYEARIAALRARYREAPPLRVFYQIGADPLFTINRDSPISEALVLCGAHNVFADLPRLAAAVGREAVLAADPQAIVWADDAESPALRAAWQRWSQLSAVRHDNLFALDGDLLARATPRMAAGTEQLCATLDRARAHLGY